jgi:hypothetical protein
MEMPNLVSDLQGLDARMLDLVANRGTYLMRELAKTREVCILWSNEAKLIPKIQTNHF